MNRAMLFRPAALEHRQHQWLGEVVLTGSGRQLATSVLFFALAIMLILFLLFADYTRKEEVPGRVMIDNGAAEIFAPTVGTVVRLFVSEGDVVKIGQPLLAVSTERTSVAGIRNTPRDEQNQLGTITRQTLEVDGKIRWQRVQ